ncbi:hypothetical protein Q4E93_04765 [Flavitalea sp. BT771]|uniref:hypothetical protein n=1 Tax=Flavitalea sp. BT771 TaxID=3063329 RepID=UPI0026E13529|nr:hypothetical protein [Flavitalea sp. BT771]MDO6429881.1 hypothetical protein [Flavitalea sp. BT771]MDV6217991.1 hypothetical protein [Flavitalea sp. BT771]
MKKHIKLLSSISLFLVLSQPVITRAANGDDDVRKKKTINRSYNVGPDDKLEIENQFGNVRVATWDQNQITVDIEIGVRASSEEKAKDIMDELDVKEVQSGHIISFKTKVGEIHNNDGKHHGKEDDDRSFYIDYIVHMPAANRLVVENSFGKTEMGDFKGLVSLTSKFGSLNTGRLDNVDVVDVEFGKAYIAEVANGKLVFKFCKESRIGKVNGNVRINSEFSHNVQFIVADNIQDLAVSESYSTVRMVVTKSLSAQFDVHTSFGSFHNDSEFNIKEKRDNEDSGPHFDKDYSGQAGDGKARIKIKSSFGTVRVSYTGAAPGSKDKDKKDKDKGDKDEDKDDDEKTT